MLRSTEGQDQVAAFVALTMHRKMELGQECPRRPKATTAQYLMPDLTIPSSSLLLVTQQQNKKTIRIVQH